MSKDILERARREHNSEYEDSVLKNVMMYTNFFTMFLIVGMSIIRYREAVATGNYKNGADLLIVFFGIQAFQNILMYFKLRKKMDLFKGICNLLSFILFIIFSIRVF